VTARCRRSIENVPLHISNGENWCRTTFYLRELYREKIHMNSILPNHWFRPSLTKIAATLIVTALSISHA